VSFNPGKNVGRVSIRVVPDTRGFRKDLKRQLEVIARTTDAAVTINRVKLDKTRIRESIRRQLATLDDVAADSNVQVTIDGAKIRRGKLRKSIQAQFDAMGDVRVWIKPGIHKRDQEVFARQVKRMVDRAEDTVHIGVAAHTAAATAQLRYTTRPRFVDIFVRINKASLTKAVATLAALSGARLTWKWIDELIEKMGRLDKTLPTILNWTSGITAFIAALAGATSGLVGIGQGLFTILPAFLVVPGLILNAIGSLTVLIVALKHSREELGALSGDMNELGAIIRTTFWDNARKPIIDMVRGLMPQLRNSFRQLAQGVGEFTGALAKAFGQELAGGRLEGIFAGIAEGWRVLGSGASGFAGALVSLSEIAAKYTPRLAGWFVRQANTFDAWLTAIATDRRLDRWMETAIDSMYDLWDATRGFAGVLAGIWRAADQAGSGGLEGFGQLMLKWREVVNGADFQRGLAAIFRGSYVAMDAFGEAIKSLGRLIEDMPAEFERFVGSVGGFLGGIFDEAFRALNNENVAIGLDGFSAGLETALAGITPALGPIASTFGNFLGLLGDLAGNLLPTAADAFAALMPGLDLLIGAVEDVLPGLSTAVGDVASVLGPALESFVGAVTPALQVALQELADALVLLMPHIALFVTSLGPVLASTLDRLIPVLEPLAQVLGFLVDAISGLMQAMGFISNVPNLFNPQSLLDPSKWFDFSKIPEKANEAMTSGSWFGGLMQQFSGLGTQGADLFVQSWGTTMSKDLLNAYTSQIQTAFAQSPSAGAAMWQSFLDTGMPPEVVEAVQSNLAEIGIAVADAATTTGEGIVGGIGSGMVSGMPALDTTITGVGEGIVNRFDPNLLVPTGENMIAGMARGIDRAAWKVASSAIRAADGAMVKVNSHLGIQSPSKKWEKQVGHWLPAGIARGIDKNAGVIERSAIAAMNFDPFGSASSPSGRVGLGNTIHVTQPLLPGETPQEQRDNLVRELQWAL
jgi:hypothetical protein